MTLTYGFYDSSSSDRVYNAKQFGSIFDGIIEDGVYAGIGGKLMVIENSPTGMSVIVQSGRAWFDHTWTLNDANLVKTIATADALLNRIDVVYLEVNEDSGTRANSINVLTGTPASTPVTPTLTNTSVIHQYPLAYIYVGAAVTEITQANITNKVGTTSTPFVAGIIDYVTTNEIVAQWEAEWDQWFQDITDQLSTEAETNLQNQIWDLAGVVSGAPPYADDMVTLAAHNHSNGNHPQIPTAGIANLAVTASKIANGTITGAQLAGATISEYHLQTNSVSSAKLQTSAVTESKIASSSISTAKLQNDAVDANKLGDNVVSDIHLGFNVMGTLRRFGGDNSNWDAQGTTSYNVDSVRMQFGSFSCAAFAQVDVTYSPAFSNRPWLLISIQDSEEVDSQVSFPIGSSFAEAFRYTHFTSGKTVVCHWIAIGPE